MFIEINVLYFLTVTITLTENLKVNGMPYPRGNQINALKLLDYIKIVKSIFKFSLFIIYWLIV
ncbi:Uncharacterised protein [[Pasteurella] mairii]|uniref:Uncharacterized protein n=1 Tax=[Pasteurella] mairii TaxID=757 RepID=A0A379B3Q8_9PAST|nr:Uncharacterised protein [[Pasteurella] mairii]